MVTEVPSGIQLQAIGGQPRPIDEWLINFQALSVVLDPFTYESAWLLDTAGRILTTFTASNIRVSFVCTCNEDEAREFLGPWVDRVLVYLDPDRELVRALELDELPACLHIRQDRVIENAAQGWQPEQWRKVLAGVARDQRWTAPVIPAPGDPAPYRGAPALV